LCKDGADNQSCSFWLKTAEKPNYMTWLLIITQNPITSAPHFPGFSLNPPLYNALWPTFRTAIHNFSMRNKHLWRKPSLSRKTSLIPHCILVLQKKMVGAWWLLLHCSVTAINPALTLYELRKEVPLFCKILTIVYHNYTYLSLWNFSSVLSTNFIQFILGARLGFF